MHISFEVRNPVILSTIAHVFSALLELIRVSRMSDHDKDLEFLALRYQLGREVFAGNGLLEYGRY